MLTSFLPGPRVLLLHQEQNMGAGDVDADDVDLASTNLEGAESADAPSSGATTLGPTPQVGWCSLAVHMV